MSPKGWLFDLLYLLGRTPWDTQQTPPEVMALLEAGTLDPGRALDLGCGTGTNCCTLARFGWEAVGVDLSTVAICRARRRSRRAGLDCRFHVGDVADLKFLDSPFGLALDIGCLHSLPPHRWERYAAGVTRLVGPGGLYMLYAFTRPAGSSVPHGISRQVVERLFTPAFAIERHEPGDDPTGPNSAWTWMRRR